MSQKLQNFAKFQNFQLDNLLDFEKCWKTRIYLQRSMPMQPKTSNILPTFCEKLATTLRVRRAAVEAPVRKRRSGSAPAGRRGPRPRRRSPRGPAAIRPAVISNIGKFWRINCRRHAQNHGLNLYTDSVRRTLARSAFHGFQVDSKGARSAFHGFSIGFQRCKCV